MAAASRVRPLGVTINHADGTIRRPEIIYYSTSPWLLPSYVGWVTISFCQWFVKSWRRIGQILPLPVRTTVAPSFPSCPARLPPRLPAANLFDGTRQGTKEYAG